MPIPEDIKPVTYMKAKAADLLRSLEENRRPVVITQNGEAKGVLLDIASYQELKDSVLMLKLLALGEADVRAGRVVPQDEAFERLAASLDSL